MTMTDTPASTATQRFTVHLIDGSCFPGIEAVDELDAVIAASAQADQDLAELVLEVEPERDEPARGEERVVAVSAIRGDVPYEPVGAVAERELSNIVRVLKRRGWRTPVSVVCEPGGRYRWVRSDGRRHRATQIAGLVAIRVIVR